MTEIRTYTHRTADVCNLTRDQIDIRDIAHSLANMCRFNGHSSRFYSVAEHSMLTCEAIAQEVPDRRVELAGLLHDAAEAYIGDISSPVKHYIKSICPAFRALEDNCQRAVFSKFGLADLTHEELEVVHYYDLRMCKSEFYQFYEEEIDNEYLKDIPLVAPPGGKVVGYLHKAGREAFLRKFYDYVDVHGVR